jgi:hypothetical protein
MATLISAERARETLRNEDGVRLVASHEEGFAAGHLPPGVYGFTSSPVLESPLFADRQYRNFEVHHRASGVIAVVGFVTAPEAALLDGERAEPVTIVLHPEPEGDAATIVSLPYAWVSHHRQYSLRNTAAIAVEVVPGRP